LAFTGLFSGATELLKENKRIKLVNYLGEEKMSPLAIVLITLIALFVIMKIVAAMRTESKKINNENPYLHPEYESVLPEEMRGYKLPIKPNRKSNQYEKVWKKVIDNILSFFGLVLLSPVFLVLCIAIVADDPGPVFFTQRRVGKDKTFFQLHKFRSMKMSTPHDMPTHMLENPDQYITRIGRFLRKSSLDELPQIWDIFRGRMSVIGPRPALWNQADLVAERERYAANDVTPGLTGWAQINGRDELEIVDKAKLDGDYCKNISLGLDIKCFFGTIRSVAKSDGVVEGGTGEMHRHEEQGK